jgi:riboflavin kinase/FMN adenylyltransferase
MSVEQEIGNFTPQKEMLLTIGVFDGVHLGHKHLISRLNELARKQGVLSGVITFSQHPQEVLSPRTKLPSLTGIDQRIALLQDEGADIVIPLPFTPQLAALSPKQFLSLLKEYLKMKGLVVGPDFALGKDRQGDTSALRRLGQEMDFSVTVVPPMTIDGQVVSSTAIRKALAEGDMKQAQKLLGRPFSLQGRVVAGDKRGTTLGFPTANLDIEPGQALPAGGVYACRAHIDGRTYSAMTNIGSRPTFGGGQQTIEVYLLDYKGDLYGRELAIDIIGRLRDEKKFDTEEQLKEQIAEDVIQGKDMLKTRGEFKL